MRKTDKKIDNKLRDALTDVCEAALDRVAGFQWLTHIANYHRFPESLSIICVFDTNAALSDARSQQADGYLYDLIKEKLAAVNIKIENIQQHVNFDTEEDCNEDNEGNWNERISAKG